MQGGDFEGFHDMGLDDREFEGLAQEMLFTKIYSIPVDNTNVRYSLSNLPARTQSKVFILVAPPTATDSHGRRSLLVGIQDPVDKRLQLLTLVIEQQQTEGKRPNEADQVSLIFGELRRVQSVVDSCKISDGAASSETMMILSEDKAGGRELSLQSPWGKVTKLVIPFLFFDNLASLDYAGSFKPNKELRNRRSIGIGATGTQIESLCHPQPRGVVDLRAKDGKYHRIRVKLQPSCRQVSMAIDACRSVLPPGLAEKVLTGWWQVTQWLKAASVDSPSQSPAGDEWSAFVILVLSCFLALESPAGDLRRPRRHAVPNPPSGSNWDAMQTFSAPNSSFCPGWMRRTGW